MSEFYLVQRLSYRPLPKDPSHKQTMLEKVGEAFGGGRISPDFTLDYMGSAEFEFGAVPKAHKHLVGKGKANVNTVEYTHPESKKVSKLTFLWREQDDDPFEAWVRWVEAGMFSKERPHELEYRLKGERPSWMRHIPEGEWETALWWALEEGVVWGFAEDGFVEKLLV